MVVVKKKPENSFQAALNRTAAAAAAAASAQVAPTSQAPVASRQPPSRQGKRLIGGHFHPDVAKHLKILAAEEDTSVQALLEEALDLLFVKKGKGRLPFD